MTQYRKKTVLIEAMQWLGEISFDELFEFADADNNYGIVGMLDGRGDVGQIRTLEGIINVYSNDWIIKGDNGELYLCDSNIFEATYEAVPIFKTYDEILQYEERQL